MSAPVGQFPVRQDITVLPEDNPAKLRLGWVIYEEVGMVCINDWAINRIEIDEGYGTCEQCGGTLDPSDIDCCPEVLRKK